MTRPRTAWPAIALATLLGTAPAQAIEEVVIKLPLLETTFNVRVSELGSADALLRGNSDLAELDRASGGSLGRQLQSLLRQPLPLSLNKVTDQAVGTPMLGQAMLMLSSFGRIDGQPSDLSGEELRHVLEQASANGRPTLLSLLQAIPGRTVTLDLAQVARVLQRMVAQRRQAEQLVSSLPPVAAARTPSRAGSVERRSLSLAVSHRPQLLELTVLQPQGGSNGRLVLISHGLWDRPASFEGWGQILAAAGYTVVLPRHPGSDAQQQQAMLSGQAPPPNHQELELRPLDLSAVIDAVDAGQLQLGPAVNTRQVVVIGHSWGATTGLLLAGVQPSDRQETRCADANDPGRNLSWALQCSWLQGVGNDRLGDGRVIAVGAVSPPVSLLFPPGSGQALSARVLLVSGSRDWVVPPDPEAIKPMRANVANGNRLVLAKGGDHFNLRPGADASGGVLGPLLLSWTNASFQAGTAVRPAPQAPNLLPPAGWGDAALTLVDVSDHIAQP
ncbi:MAG: alpha/beta fold hydrolase [Vulcanococcus sp.]